MNQKNRLEVRQFKNNQIKTRNQAQSYHQLLPNQQPVKETVVASPVTKLQEPIVPVSSTKSQQNIHKRLKLKDYLHLNGIEKRNRSKSKISNNSYTKIKTEVSETRPPKQQTIVDADIRVECKKAPQSSYTSMLKEQIIERIEQQKKKLTDLQEYLSKDFTETQNTNETFVFLFSIYNKMNDIHNINEEVGSSALNYSKQETKTAAKAKLLKKMTYHWEGDGELDSPAKIKNTTKTNFDLETILKMAK